MDVLTDVMQTVRVRSRLHGRLELTAPWGIQADGECGYASFLVVARGSCWLEMDGPESAVPLTGGDFVVLPKGSPHVLRDAQSTKPRPGRDIFGEWDGKGVFQYGGGGASTSIIFGCFEFEDGGRNPLVESLPPMIHVRADGGPSVQWLQSTLQFVASETASGLPGAETVASRLTDILFVHAIRAHIAGCGGGEHASGWLRGLADTKVGQALRLIHESPQRDWTVEALADEVKMSRSAFAARFAELVGQSPLRYITAWRVKKASCMLLHGEPISAIAQATGYATEAAFGKVFRKLMGESPGEFRRRSLGADGRPDAAEAAAPEAEEQAALRREAKAAQRALDRYARSTRHGE